MSEGRSVPDTVAPAQPPSTPPTAAVRWLVETVFIVLAAMGLAWGVRYYLAEPYLIPTGSMSPTIRAGERVIAEKVTYRFGEGPASGDIVVFDDPSGRYPQLIKRVIATQGQTVDIRDEGVYVDGRRLDEPYTHGKPTLPGSIELPLTVPDGMVWLMGDNRTNSGDSRFFGPRPVSSIRGRAVWIYWPVRAFGALK